MQASVKKSLISIAQFIGLICVAYFLEVYLLSSQSYTDTSEVSSSFPIAIQRNGSYEIIRWASYQKSPEDYKALLITQPEAKKYTLANGGSFEINKTNEGVHQLTYYSEEYNFYSEYSIKDTLVPRYFSSTSGFGFFIALALVLFLFVPINYIYKFYMVRHVKKRSNSSLR